MPAHLVSNSAYAKYMQEWMQRLALPLPAELSVHEREISAHWRGSVEADLHRLREVLWNWVDHHGGPRLTREPAMLAVRMLLCLAYAENQELQHVGYFEDLVHAAGIDWAVINVTCSAFSAQSFL